MFRIVHSFSLAVFITLAWMCAGYAQSVPVTVDGAVAGLPGTVRETCDPDIEEVIKNQAYEAAQREITQNANLYTRPDSVLSLSCFDEWLDHQNNYAENNFPVDPDESEGKLLGGLFTDLIIVLPDDIISSIDPNLTTGYVQFGILEILVLDQLESVGSISGIAADAPGFSLCGGKKDYYIEDAFPGLMIGDRAKNQAPVPAYSSISSGLNSSVGGGGYSCSMMNDVWHRAKCYDFATEEDDFYPTGTGYSGYDHDGFYQYVGETTAMNPAINDYVNSGDKRSEPDMCSSPNSTLLQVDAMPDLLCWQQIHGNLGLPAETIPGLVNLIASAGMSFPGGFKTWGSMDTDANPSAGAAGAVDEYEHFLETVSGDVTIPCTAPVKTGFIVVRKNGDTYYDAYCTNPGCFFTAPTTLAGSGTCTRP